MCRQDLAAALAKTDRRHAITLAARAQDDLVAVFEEPAHLATGQFDRHLAALGNLQQAAELARLGARQGARTEQVAWLQLAAVDTVVRNHLRHGPVHAQGVAQGQAVRRQVLLAHALGQQQHFQLDVERATRLVTRVEQVRQRLRIAFGACRLGAAERLQRLGSDHPGRHGGDEAL
uniref:Transcriptional regulator n=1 Tax=Steinernema glaseri TaxID=37863 RepID=A0A1I8AS93_9BILA